MLEINTKAPSFNLPDEEGNMHTLEEYRGHRVILYFYPRDNTPGCSKQACGFRDLYPEFLEKDAVVIGISKDSVASHKKFKEKYELPFTLLSDTEKKTIMAYDVGKEKKNSKNIAVAPRERRVSRNCSPLVLAILICRRASRVACE